MRVRRWPSHSRWACGRLHHRHIGGGKVASQLAQPLRVHHVVGVHHAYPAGLGAGMFQRVVQCSGLVTGPLGQVVKMQPRVFEVIGKLLQRLPQRGVLGVVVHHHNFQPGPVQRQQAFHGGQHHVGRFVAAGQVDAHQRQRRAIGQGIAFHRGGFFHLVQAAAPEQFGKLQRLGQQDGAHQHERGHQQPQQQDVVPAQIVRQRLRAQQHGKGSHRLHTHRKREAPGNGHAREDVQKGQQRNERQHGRRRGLGAPVRVGLQRPVHGKLGRTVGIQVAPVRAHPAFGHGLPGLVYGFHHVVVEGLVLYAAQKLADEAGLVVRGGPGTIDGEAAAGPAYLANHHRLVGEGGAHLAVAAQRFVHRSFHRNPFPVGQQVDGDEVHVLGQFGLRDPDVPGLGGGNRHAEPGAQAVQVGVELLRFEQGVELGFVAGNDTRDVGVAGHRRQHRLDLEFVVLCARIEPDTRSQLEALLQGQPGKVREFAGAVGAQPVGVGRQRGEVGLHLVAVGKPLADGAVPTLEGVVGHAGELFGSAVGNDGWVEHTPEDDVQGHHGQREQSRYHPRAPARGAGGRIDDVHTPRVP
jgi:hypothetical protein